MDIPLDFDRAGSDKVYKLTKVLNSKSHQEHNLASL